MFRTLKCDLEKTMIYSGFLISVVLTYVLCFTASAYIDSVNEKSYTVFEVVFRNGRTEAFAHHPELTDIEIFLKAFQGYLTMFMPVVSSFPFVFSFHTQKNNSVIRFEKYDENVEACYTDGGEAIKKLVPSTLEGCVVRICDIIAYIGKDRQDAITAKILSDDSMFSSEFIGSHNAEMINNLTVDIVNNSLGKDCIILSEQAFSDLKTAKKENYEYIYRNEKIESQYNEIIKPMFRELYYKLLRDVKDKNITSFIYKHHINAIQKSCQYYEDWNYISEEPNQIVVDFIASMTDDYFIDLYRLLFPDSDRTIEYHSYFENQ